MQKPAPTFIWFKIYRHLCGLEEDRILAADQSANEHSEEFESFFPSLASISGKRVCCTPLSQVKGNGNILREMRVYWARKMVGLRFSWPVRGCNGPSGASQYQESCARYWGTSHSIYSPTLECHWSTGAHLISVSTKVGVPTPH